MRSNLRSLVSMGMLLSVGCAPRAYLHAVTSYAATAATSLTTLQDATQMADRSCHESATADYINAHIDIFKSTGGGSSDANDKWFAFYDQHSAASGSGQTLTWKSFCEHVAENGSSYSAALRLLSTYSDALATLTHKGEWDGQALHDTVKGLADAVSVKADASNYLSAAAGPAQKLGALIVASYTAKKAHAFVADANPSFQEVVKGLKNYLAAVDRDVIAPSAKDRTLMLRNLETYVWPAPAHAGGAPPAVGPSPLDPARAISFIHFVRATQDDIASIHATTSGYVALLDKLAVTHDALAKLPPTEVNAATVAAEVVDLVNQLSSVQSVLAENK